MKVLRTRFAREIVAEFLPPARPTSQVIILCPGMPSIPQRQELLRFYSEKGYWVFYPRYRGSWESDGLFLKQSPHEDILDIVQQLPKGFQDLQSRVRYQVNPCDVYCIGWSFGGPAAILASQSSRVTKSVALASTIDFRFPGEEPYAELYKYVRKAFGNGYRFHLRDWRKLLAGKFYSPVNHLHELDGRKLLLIHARDDKVDSYVPAEDFSKRIGAKLILLDKGGHISSVRLMEPQFHELIESFFEV